MSGQRASAQFPPFPFQPDKFRELMLYIAQRWEDDPTFGQVKLNKALYYADFEAYRRLGQPITGAVYQKLAEGPAPRELLAARDSLLKDGDATIEDRPTFLGVQKRLTLARGRQPNREVFAPGELDVVDEVVDFFRGKSAREVSDCSHREPGWRAAQLGESIPYETAWLSAGPMDQETETRVRALVPTHD